jgi:hypothetical protein
MHSARSFRKRIGEIRTPAQVHPKLLRSPNRPMARDLSLARICQAAALTALEYRSAAPVQYRDALLAESAVDRGCAAEPGTYTAEVAPRPRDRHPLLNRFPVATSFKGQDHSIGCDPHIDAA